MLINAVNSPVFRCGLCVVSDVNAASLKQKLDKLQILALQHRLQSSRHKIDLQFDLNKHLLI